MNMRFASFTLVFLSAGFVACTGQSAQSNPETTDTTRQPARDAHQEWVDTKRIYQSVFGLLDRPLKDFETCTTSGSEFSDRTLGDFVAGLLASTANGRNEMVTECTGIDTELRRCRWLIRHADGEDVWEAGIEFHSPVSKLQVLTETVRCIGP